MNLHDFYYDLPQELIAQEPLKDRSSSRLLVLHRDSGEIEHKIFRDVKDYLKKGDCLVINDTKVMPARLIGARKNTGARVEILLLVRKDMDTWEVLTYPGKKAKPGDVIVFGDGRLEAEILEVIEGGNRIVKFRYDGVFETILDELGEMPLPPYITHKLEDKNRYQTVYAVHEGSAAAPTAGFHFTKELFDRLEKKGVEVVDVTLHVGLGTFRPVKEDDIRKHDMHSEYYVMEKKAADALNKAKEEKRRIIAIGTTSTRTLESVYQRFGRFEATSGETKLFIYPGYRYQAIDCLITNFHLPKSTLLMLVSAFSSRDIILAAYRHAVQEKYRFFSFGDAMFLTKGLK